MKKYIVLLALPLIACAASLRAQINCLNYPHRVAPVWGYPTPRCTLLTPLFCNAAAMVHTDSVDFNSGHISAEVCAQFGLNPLADGRMALCFGRNVPTHVMSSFFTAPTGQVLVFELNLAKTPDMLYAWTYKNGVITKLDSTPAISGLLNLVNGYARFFEFSFNSGDPGLAVDPNKNRMKFYIDGEERMNKIYDVMGELWDGNRKARFWISSVAGLLPINSQAATMFPTTCETQIPLLKQQGHDGQANDVVPALHVEVYPNPSPGGSFELTTNRMGSFRMVSLLGTLVAEGQIPAGKTRITTVSLSKGVYVLEFVGDGQVAHRRIVVE